MPSSMRSCASGVNGRAESCYGSTPPAPRSGSRPAPRPPRCAPRNRMSEGSAALRAGVEAFTSGVRADPELARALRHASRLPPEAAARTTAGSLPESARALLRARGIDALYPNQTRALAALAGGRDVVLATPTASGKSLVYAMPALEAALADPGAHALFLFPLKALEQDQAKKLEGDALALGLPPERTVAIYDGDTKPAHHQRIRRMPPHLLITTPDMLHLGLLPHHMSWEGFFRGLSLV